MNWPSIALALSNILFVGVVLFLVWRFYEWVERNLGLPWVMALSALSLAWLLRSCA